MTGVSCRSTGECFERPGLRRASRIVSLAQMGRIVASIAVATACLATFASSAGAAGPEIDVSPTTFEFGTHEVGTSASMGLDIENTGDSPLHLGAFSITGPAAHDFFTSGSCGEVSPGGACITSAYFGPSQRGLRSATLTIPSDDVDEPTVQVSLNGTAIAPVLV